MYKNAVLDYFEHANVQINTDIFSLISFKICVDTSLCCCPFHFNNLEESQFVNCHIHRQKRPIYRSQNYVPKTKLAECAKKKQPNLSSWFSILVFTQNSVLFWIKRGASTRRDTCTASPLTFVHQMLHEPCSERLRYCKRVHYYLHTLQLYCLICEAPM